MSTAYNLILTPEFFGEVKRGAFDHWKGETVPLRGPNRELIGEAKVLDVDHREDGIVYVIVETELDVIESGNIQSVADVIRGRSGMSFSLPHHPERDDDVARWIKSVRDRFRWGARNRTVSFNVLDDLLDEYRARADYGLTLDDDITQFPDYGSGDYVARRDTE